DTNTAKCGRMPHYFCVIPYQSRNKTTINGVPHAPSFLSRPVTGQSHAAQTPETVRRYLAVGARRGLRRDDDRLYEFARADVPGGPGRASERRADFVVDLGAGDRHGTVHHRPLAALSRPDRDRMVDARCGAARHVAAARWLCTSDRRVYRVRAAA